MEHLDYGRLRSESVDRSEPREGVWRVVCPGIESDHDLHLYWMIDSRVKYFFICPDIFYIPAPGQISRGGCLQARWTTSVEAATSALKNRDKKGDKLR